MTSTCSDEWTERKCLQLIREYRARPLLWDPKNPFFYKKSMKPPAWEEIGAVFKTSGVQCKHKMLILMSSFRREKARIIQSLRNSADTSEAYKSTWFAFKELAFLLDKDSERKRHLNDSDGEDEEVDNNIIKLLQHHLDTPVLNKKRIRVSKPAKLLNRNSSSDREDLIIPQLQPSPGPSQTISERDEEIKSFTSFIGNKMKKYSDTSKNAVQQAICHIIFKADLNYYENKCYEKFTIIDEELDPLNKHNNIYDEDKTVKKIENDSDSD